MVAENAILQFSEQEALIERVARDTIALDAFMKQWIVEDLPACPTGMVLLKRFADAHPEEFAVAKESGFTPQPLPFFNQNKLWQEYTAHYGSCYDCNESGAQPIAYDGRVQVRAAIKEEKPRGVHTKAVANRARLAKRPVARVPDLFSDSIGRKQARKARA